MITGLLTTLHVIGLALGAGGAFFAEVFYMKALRDGVVDPTEGAFLAATYRVLRLGMVLLILSGFGFFILYRMEGNTELLYSAKYWAKMTLVFIILANALCLQARRMPFWLGSALSFTSWFAALIIGAWGNVTLSYMEIMLAYALAIPVVAGILELIRKQFSAPAV